MSSKRKTTFAMLALVVVAVNPLNAAVINWISPVSGVWADGGNWFLGNVPGPADDAKHINAALASAITVRQTES